jgi:dTDP-4-dehydrorhamnose reductase
MRFLLLGGSGQVGEEFRALSFPSDVEVVAPDRAALDLTDAGAITRMLAAGPWSAVINAAAYTDVDHAETQHALAFVLNAQVPSQLAAETAWRAIPLLHISTDYVFDGRKGTPYVEADEPGPLNAYGRSKLAGEVGVRSGNRQHIILRSSWIYSPFRKNFVRTILRLAAERQELTIVADQRGGPTAARDIAQACLNIAMRCVADGESTAYGTYHFTGAGDTTWFEFAGAIVDAAGDRLARRPQVLPTCTADYPTSAERPADSRLDCSAIARTFGITPRPWRQSLAETIDRLLTKEAAR